MNIFKILGLD